VISTAISTLRSPPSTITSGRLPSPLHATDGLILRGHRTTVQRSSCKPTSPVLVAPRTLHLLKTEQISDLRPFRYEGSYASTSPGPPSFQFEFAYWIQTDNGVPWDNYHAYTGDKCIAQLEAYALAAWAPNAAGWPTSAGECFDTSGFDTFADPDNFIVFSVLSPA
jgi:hypothetical protein